MGVPKMKNIDKTVYDAFEKLYLPSQAEEEIKRVLYYKIHENEWDTGIPYNILLVGEDDETLSNVGEILSKLIADNDSQNRVFKIVDGKNIRTIIDDLHIDSYSSIFIDRLDEADDEQLWSEFKDTFEKFPSVIKIVSTTPEIYENFLRKDNHFYYRIMSHHINLMESTDEDIYGQFVRLVKSSGFEVTNMFEKGIKEYINIVYPKADLKGKQFITDLKRRVIEPIISKENVEKILDENCIPNYNRDDLSEKIENTYSIEDYIEEQYVDSNFPVAENNNKEDGVNVALFALSTFPGSKRPSVFEKGGLQIDYYHQQETALLNERLNRGKNGIDYLIILITESTARISNEKPLEPIADKMYYFLCSAKDYICRVAEKGNILNNTKTDKLEILSSYRFDKLEDSNNERIIFISVENKTEEGIAMAISKTIAVIQEIKKHGKTNIYYYNNGGLREIPMYLETIMSLIKEDEGINIQNNIIEYEVLNGKGTARLKSAGQGVVDFVSGINEFNNYGKTDSLNKYYANQEKYNGYKIDSYDKEFLDSLNHIAYGIQANFLGDFINGLDELKKKKESGRDRIHDSYLNTFYNEIMDNIQFIDFVKGSIEYVSGMIEWSLKKGYYQQTLTMIESLVPEILHKAGVFSYYFPGGDEYIRTNSMPNQSPVNAVFNSVVIYHYKIIKGKEGDSVNKFDGSKILTKSNNSKNVFAHRVKIKSTNEVWNLIKDHNILKELRNDSNHMNANNSIGISKEVFKQKVELYLERLSKILDDADNQLLKVKKLDDTSGTGTTSSSAGSSGGVTSVGTSSSAGIEKSIVYDVTIKEKGTSKSGKNKGKTNLKLEFELDGNVVKGTLPCNEYEAHESVLGPLSNGDKIKCSINSLNKDTYQMKFISL